MSSHAPTPARLKHARNLAAVSVLVAAAMLLRMASAGFPASWIDRLSEAFSTPRFAFELERVSLSLLRRELDIGRIRVYPRGHVSEAVLELLDTSIRVRPERGEHPLGWIRSIRARHLVIPPSAAGLFARPAAATPVSPTPARGPARTTPPSPGLLLPQWKGVPLRVDHVSVLGASTARIAATLTHEAGRLYVDSVITDFSKSQDRVERLDGRLVVDLSPFALEVQASGAVDAASIQPIFEAVGLPGVANEINRFAFPEDVPDLRFSILFAPARNRRELTLHLETGYALYNDIPIRTGSATLRIAGTRQWSPLRIEPLVLVRPEGRAEGFLDVDTESHLLRFALDSTVDPLHMLRIVRISSEPVALPFSLDNPTRITASGRVDLARNPTRTDVALTLESPRISTQGIPFDAVRATGTLTDTVWRIHQAGAAVYDGTFTGNAVFTPSPTNSADVSFTAAGRFSDLRQTHWSARLGGSAPDSNGILNLDATLAGRIAGGTDTFLESLSGAGRLALKDVQLYRVPLFAGFTEMIAAVIPGVDFLLSQDALTTDVALETRTLSFSETKIIGNVFSASGGGAIDFDANLDLRLKVHLLNRETWVGKSLYYILFPISKIFEIQATGTLNQPRWSSATLSSGR